MSRASPADAQAGTALQLPPLSLYIHIPWCIRKCPYCDFNSHQKNGELPEAAYIDALLQDFRLDLDYVQNRPISSIFFGGGTPSLFSAQAYSRLLNELNTLSPFASDIEITLEANPGTAERQNFLGYRAAGINRLSIGVQSFDERQLARLGRIHNGNDAQQAIELAAAAGFDNLNIDIMYGLEAQSSDQAMQDLQKALSFQPAHLSWYQLTIEPNTEFHKRPPPLPPEQTLLDIQDQGLALLEREGMQRYEVSAFAREGRQARHNLNYWLFGDYIGIGAGAHGKVSLPEKGYIVRTRKKRQPGHYLDSLSGKDAFTAETSAIGSADRVVEFMLNALRLQAGFAPQVFEQRTGLPFSLVEKQIEFLHNKQLLEVSSGNVRTTERGMQFLNTILEEFI